MTTPRLDVAYSPDYLQWLLGPGHPTNPRRAELAVEMLVLGLPRLGIDIEVMEPVPSSAEMLERVHSESYVKRTLSGDNTEWSGWGEARPDLGRVAALMSGGTELLARRIVDGTTRFGFNPQGAKHHAHRSRGGGFCVFNDMALATRMFTDAGLRVGYLDFDVHHGDGVEALLREERQALTASVHEDGIFPGTGTESAPDLKVFNWPLPGGTGDEGWLAAVGSAVDTVRGWGPDVLLVAIGADAHETDPLSSLMVTEDGYRQAGQLVGDLVGDLEIPVLMGGAGGYQPLSWTPRIWTTVVTEVLQRSSPSSDDGGSQRGSGTHVQCP